MLKPNVQFCEFSGNSWAEHSLGEVVKIERGRFSPRPRNDPQYYGGEIPFAQTNDVTSSDGRIKLFSQTLNEKGLKVSKLFPEGTILMTIAANIGHCGILTRPMACPDSIVGINCKKGVYNHFLNIYLNREQPRIDYLAPRAAQKNINIEFLAPYKIRLPKTLLEQQKIADFLTAVDSKISQLTEKRRLLNEYKKGAMQQLFSQQLRFKDEKGNAFPEWAVKRLGDIASFLKGKGISKADIQVDGLTRCIRYGELYTTYGEVITSVVSAINMPVNELVLSKSNDVIVPSSGETQWDIATAACVLLNGIAYSGDLTIIRSQINGVFLSYYLNSAKKREIASLSQGGSVIHLYSTHLKHLEIDIPCADEQQRIAQFLQAIDNKIAAVAEQIEQTKQFKKGLLQQMFV